MKEIDEMLDVSPWDELAVIPVQLYPPSASQLPPFSAFPGIKLTPLTGYFLAAINKFNKANLQLNPSKLAAPTHLIVIRMQEYLRGFERRLARDGISLGHEPIRFFDLDGLKRQVLVSLTLIAGISWTVGEVYPFMRKLGARGRYTMNSASYRRPECIEPLIAQALAQRHSRGITASQVRYYATRLDRYYRVDHSWLDPLGIALGYLWSSLTANNNLLAFAGLCMTLEALVRPGDNEITHQLAERCSILTRATSDPTERYRVLKRLYGLRSRIVHGNTGLKKGTIHGGMTFMTPKRSNIAAGDLKEMVNVTLDTVQGALQSPNFLRCIHRRATDKETTRAVDDYFLSALLKR